MRIKADTLIVLAAVGAGLYFASKLLHVGSQATDAAAKGIADLYVWFTAGPPVQASGSIVFQNGTIVPISALPGPVTFNDRLGVGQFTYGGVQYAIYQGSRDANGNYPAVPMSDVSQVLSASGNQSDAITFDQYLQAIGG